MTESNHVKLHKKMLENHKRRIKGVTDPVMKELVQRDIDETTQRINRIIELENKANGK